MGMASLIFELHPPNFWKCLFLKDVQMMYVIIFLSLFFKKIGKNLPKDLIQL